MISDEPRTEDLDYKDQGRDHPAERTVPNDTRKPPARPTPPVARHGDGNRGNNNEDEDDESLEYA